MKLKLSLQNKFLYVEREDGLILGKNLPCLEGFEQTVEIDTEGDFISSARRFLDELKKKPEPEAFSEEDERELINKMKELWSYTAKKEFELESEKRAALKEHQVIIKILSEPTGNAAEPFTNSQVYDFLVKTQGKNIPTLLNSSDAPSIVAIAVENQEATGDKKKE